MARCRSAATTEESTPPDRPSRTPSRPDLLAHACDGVFDDVAGVPQRIAAADLAHEPLEDRPPRPGMGDFGMELHAVVAPCVVRHRGERRVGGGGNDGEPRRQRLDAIAVTHPHVEHAGVRRAFIGDSVQQAGPCDAPHARVAELPVRRRGDAAAELRSHGVHAVADAEHGHAELEHGARRARGLAGRSRIPGRRRG